MTRTTAIEKGNKYRQEIQRRYLERTSKSNGLNGMVPGIIVLNARHPWSGHLAPQTGFGHHVPVEGLSRGQVGHVRSAVLWTWRKSAPHLHRWRRSASARPVQSSALGGIAKNVIPPSFRVGRARIAPHCRASHFRGGAGSNVPNCGRTTVFQQSG